MCNHDKDGTHTCNHTHGAAVLKTPAESKALAELRLDLTGMDLDLTDPYGLGMATFAYLGHRDAANGVHVDSKKNLLSVEEFRAAAEIVLGAKEDAPGRKKYSHQDMATILDNIFLRSSQLIDRHAPLSTEPVCEGDECELRD